MADYRQCDARYTMILIRMDGGLWRRHDFDLVRFNVDEDESAEVQIVPVGNTDHGKIFEKIWKVSHPPFKKKQDFNHDSGRANSA